MKGGRVEVRKAEKWEGRYELVQELKEMIFLL